MAIERCPPPDLRDPACFARVFAEHAATVHGTALVVLRDPLRAEDVVQDVFLRLWRRPDAFDPARGDLTAFLRLMARSRAVDLWREGQARDRARRRVLAALAPRAGGRAAVRPELRATAADTPDGVALRSAERARLRVALRTLPPEQRQAVALAYVGGLTAEEIAARDGIPLGTVKSRVRLGLHKLRDALPAAGESCDRGDPVAA
jgi:RNA polymerase sigma-70 factor, ECF subfamily